MKIYVNGKLDAAYSAKQSSIQTNNYDLRLGKIPLYGSPWNQFNGLMDDVRIYNRALSAEEVKQLYKDGK